jgi:cell division septum initiation protein DivIVA
MPIRPEDLTVSGLPRSSLPGGIKADAAADLLQRAAWDYSTVLRQARELSEAVNEQARRIEELETQIASLEADVATRSGPDTAEIGKALLAATRAGEEIAAEARLSAEQITTDAEARAAAILEQATTAAAEHERASVEARERLEIELAAARAAAEQELAAGRAELERERERLERDQEASQALLERERTQVLGEAQKQAEGIIADAQREIEQLESYREQLRSLLTDSPRRFVELAESALRQLDGVDARGGPGDADLLDELRPPDGKPSSPAAAGD